MLLPQPSERIAWSDRRLLPVWIALAAAFIVAVVFLPRTMINSDECYYAGEARMLLHGRLVPVDGDAIAYFPDRAAFAARFPLGWPLLLAVAALAGFRAMFFVPLLVHLTGAAAVGRMLVRRGAAPWLVVVYLFHPVLWGFSRTLMSDVPTATFLVLALDAWEQRKPAVSALGFGYALFLRLASVMLVAGFGLAVLGEAKRRWRDLAVLAAGCVVGVAAVLAVNTLAHGHPWKTPYTQAGGSGLTGTMVPEHLLLYLGGLLVIPPCPLACLIIRPRECDRWALVGIPTLLFFVAYSYHDAGSSLLQTLIGGQRLIVAVHAVLLVATARVWSRFPLLRFRALVVAGGVAAAVAECLVARPLYRRYEPAVDAMAAAKPSRIAYSESASRVALSVTAEAYYLVDGREPPSATDIIVVALRTPTNRPQPLEVTYQLPASLRERQELCRQYGEFMVFDLTSRAPRGGAPCAFPAE